ncbi:MAG: hypothetical protein DHS20C16_14610 [Phycisphaerae bacterium]|nr:MAG: hypothetical protein DHS20C16_14610 [Phycisphaerae bacterium]
MKILETPDPVPKHVPLSHLHTAEGCIHSLGTGPDDIALDVTVFSV